MRIFWKLFLAFWTTTIVMVVISVWLTTVVGRNTIGQVDRSEIANAAQSIAREIGQRGMDALTPEAIKKHKTSGVRLVVHDGNGAMVVGRMRRDTITEKLTAWLAGISAKQVQVTDPSGQRFTVSTYAHGNVPRRLVQQYQWFRFLLMVTVSGIFCYLIARYIFAPILAINRTSQLLSDGELTARVPARVCKRSDEFGSLGRNYNGMASRLVSQIDTQAQLLRDVSHELRSPLTRLQVALGLIEKSGESVNAKSIARIETEASRLEDMISRILSVARMDSDEQEHAFEPVELVELVSKVVRDASFEGSATNKHVKLNLATPVQTMANVELLQSAIENVVRNALRYTTPEHPVEVSVGRVSGDSRQIQITVSDGGPGVPEEDVDRLFDPFFRVSDARDRKSGGAGLGLSIADRAVHVHGGTIEAENRLSGGLQVTIRMPLIEPAEEHSDHVEFAEIEHELRNESREVDGQPHAPLINQAHVANR